MSRWLVAACCIPSAVSAEPPRHAWLYGTDVLAAPRVELESWVAERDDFGPSHVQETSLWVGPRVGVTERLELAVPFELRWASADGLAPGFTFDRYGVELRYRITQPRSAVPALVRAAVKRDVVVRDRVQLEGDGVVGISRGRVAGTVDLGVLAQVNPGGIHAELRPGAGVSVAMRDDLRLGAEVYGELAYQSVESGGTSWAGVGPDVAWTHGRFWLTAAVLVGIRNVKAAPRVRFGIAF